MVGKWLQECLDSQTILALDLGTKTGWALFDKNCKITSGTKDFTPKRFSGGGMRYLQFKNWLEEINRIR